MVALEAFESQFQGFKEVEANKNQLIEDLITRVRELESGLQDERLHLEREQEATKSFQARLHDALFVSQKREQEIESNGFVSVLLDGDCMLFLDGFITGAEQGGMEAARQLRSSISECISSYLKLPPNIPIRIRMYANTKGLGSTYCYNDLLRSAGDLQMFIRGFNMGSPMCDFVDAGDGKECADSKLKACFNLDMADVQCKAVFFGGSADNGYARLLQPFIGYASTSGRIVLIEGPTFSRELAALASHFHVARFTNVFRTAKFPARRVSFSAPAASYAAAIIANPSVPEPSPSDFPRVEHRSNVLQNSKGQRLDSILTPSPKLVKVLKNKKQCNAFHILGECYYSNCTFIHGVRLVEKEIDARRWIARQAVCQMGFKCREEKCLLGHQCPEKSCARIDNGCRFSKEMHNVSRDLPVVDR